MVISHSWGDNVFRNFVMYATAEDEDWVERHIAHYANIAGPTLGVPKSISSFLSGMHRLMHRLHTPHHRLRSMHQGHHAYFKRIAQPACA